MAVRRSLEQIVKEVNRKVSKAGEFWSNKQPAFLGNYARVVEVPRKNGYVYARLQSGQVVEVFNQVAPNIYNWSVYVGKDKSQPGVLKVLETRWIHNIREQISYILFHHKQHEFPAPDTVWIYRDQFMPLLIFPAGGLSVKLFGDIIYEAGMDNPIRVPDTDIDMTSYVPSTGARYILIEVEQDGSLNYITGTSEASREILQLIGDIPAPTDGAIPLAAIITYKGQTEIRRDSEVRDIIDLRMFTSAAGRYTRLFEFAVAPTVNDDETLGYRVGDVWIDTVTGTPYINVDDTDTAAVWVDMTGGGGGASFNDAEGDPENVDNSVAADGTSTYAARRDHTHFLDMSAYINALTLSATAQPEDYFMFRRDTDGLMRKMDFDAFVNNHLHPNLLSYFADILHTHSVSHGDTTDLDDNDHPQYLLTTGWVEVFQTWTYVSADDPVYKIYVSGDVTADPLYKLGNKVRCTNNSTTFYGFIVKLEAYDSGNDRTPVHLYGGTTYDLANSAITAPHVSPIHNPDAFSLNPDIWDKVATDVADRTQNSPAVNPTIYNPGGVNIVIPIGLWSVSYKVLQRAAKNAATLINMYSTLSTANNTESDPDFTVLETLGGASGSLVLLTTQVCIPKTLNLTTKTTYYLNCYTTIATMGSIGHRGDAGTTFLKARFLYL